MKVYPDEPTGALSAKLKRSLAFFRAQRAFSPKHWCEAKGALLNEYMRACRLSACVVALSGGVDSALVLALAHQASLQKNSPIRRVVPVSLPVNTPGAATGQSGATARAKALAEWLGLDCLTVDLSGAHQAVKHTVDAALALKGENWASGQLAATVRTPAYYYITSVLAEQGLPALVLGTTNRDEGAYLGYVGKASDAIVDLQLIADLHKSEVYAAAEFLKVTPAILTVAPAGDMYDGRTDVEVFGASYDALELYLSMLEASSTEQAIQRALWDERSVQQYAKIAHNLETLHAYNAHKYRSGWPGIFLNILPASIPGGWQMPPVTPSVTKPAHIGQLSGLIELGVSLDEPKAFPFKLKRKQILHNSTTGLRAEQLKGLLNHAEIHRLLRALSPHEGFPVGTSGYESEYRPRAPIGSYRLRAYDEPLAEALWRRLKSFLPCCTLTPEGASADSPALVWRPVGVSALFRFIRYEQGGVLVAHYDSPYRIDENLMTLKSLVIYLTDSLKDDGQTRFIHDAQDLLRPEKRNYADWPRAALAEEVLAQVLPRAGDAVLFDHRLLHDGAALPPGASKLIIRTDILYQAIYPACATAAHR